MAITSRLLGAAVGALPRLRSSPFTKPRWRWASRRLGSGTSAQEVEFPEAAKEYKLPPPTWSLADLNLTPTDDDSERPPLTAEEVETLCALARLELDHEGSSSKGFDVATVQRDVGALICCMKTMSDGVSRTRRAERERSWGGAGGQGHADGGGGGDDGAPRQETPWGFDDEWTALLHGDDVAEGGIPGAVTASAARLDGGCFTAPGVMAAGGKVTSEGGGEEEGEEEKEDPGLGSGRDFGGVGEDGNRSTSA